MDRAAHCISSYPGYGTDNPSILSTLPEPRHRFGTTSPLCLPRTLLASPFPGRPRSRFWSFRGSRASQRVNTASFCISSYHTYRTGKAFAFFDLDSLADCNTIQPLTSTRRLHCVWTIWGADMFAKMHVVRTIMQLPVLFPCCDDSIEVGPTRIRGGVVWHRWHLLFSVRYPQCPEERHGHSGREGMWLHAPRKPGRLCHGPSAFSDPSQLSSFRGQPRLRKLPFFRGLSCYTKGGIRV